MHSALLVEETGIHNVHRKRSTWSLFFLLATTSVITVWFNLGVTIIGLRPGTSRQISVYEISNYPLNE
jgi:hypothetical protein